MPEPFPQSAEGLRIRLRAALEACVQSGCISERERVVVVIRFARAFGRWHTLAATGSVIGGAGKERVRQMQNRAIWTLRRCAEIDELLQAYLRQIPLPRKVQRRPLGLAPNRLLQAMATEQATEKGRGE